MRIGTRRRLLLKAGEIRLPQQHRPRARLVGRANALLRLEVVGVGASRESESEHDDERSHASHSTDRYGS
jgi:hypothetical protein